MDRREQSTEARYGVGALVVVLVLLLSASTSPPASAASRLPAATGASQPAESYQSTAATARTSSQTPASTMARTVQAAANTARVLATPASPDGPVAGTPREVVVPGVVGSSPITHPKRVPDPRLSQQLWLSRGPDLWRAT
jgi:hypothetical protein